MYRTIKISVLTNSRLSALARACAILRASHDVLVSVSVFSTLPRREVSLKDGNVAFFNEIPIRPGPKGYAEIAEETAFKHSDICLLFYTRLVPEQIFTAKRTVNFHPSLLPEFPGLSGFENACAARQLAFTAHEVDASMDGGGILLQYEISPFPERATASELTTISSQLCSAVITEVLLDLFAGRPSGGRRRRFGSSEEALTFVRGGV